jgi:hypothetical protein
VAFVGHMRHQRGVQAPYVADATGFLGTIKKRGSYWYRQGKQEDRQADCDENLQKTYSGIYKVFIPSHEAGKMERSLP